MADKTVAERIEAIVSEMLTRHPDVYWDEWPSRLRDITKDASLTPDEMAALVIAAEAVKGLVAESTIRALMARLAPGVEER